MAVTRWGTNYWTDTHAYESSGEYTIRLHAEDEGGASHQYELNVLACCSGI